MLSPPGELSFSFIKKEDMIIRKEETDLAGSSFSTHLDSNPHKPIEVSSSSLSSSEEEECDENGQYDENTSKQLVLYDPLTNVTGNIKSDPDPLKYQPPSTSCLPPNSGNRVWPSVGAFTVQCANCFKWRLIPTKEKYEEIREHILEVPFVCETAREWRSNISCDDPADISQDGSRLWAIDKPNIAQPPQGWQRILHIRGEGCTKFADIYYQAPSGKRLRSMVEIQKYLLAHPEYIRDGVSMSQFSFQSPKPLQENYVRKRPPRLTSSFDGSNEGMPRTFISSEVKPLSWAGPADSLDLQLAGSGPSNPHFDAPILYHGDQPVNKKVRKTPSEQIYSSNPVDKVEV